MRAQTLVSARYTTALLLARRSHRNLGSSHSLDLGDRRDRQGALPHLFSQRASTQPREHLAERRVHRLLEGPGPQRPGHFLCGLAVDVDGRLHFWKDRMDIQNAQLWISEVIAILL